MRDARRKDMPPIQPIQPPSNRPPGQRGAGPARGTQRPFDDRPVEYWPTAAIRAALETDDLTVWQRIVAAIKRDPYGRTARQVEEVLETARPYGVSKALAEVLVRTRENLEASERAEVAKQIQAMLRRSALAPQEFASRIGVSNEAFATYLEGSVSPPASLLLRMQRLSDRFAKIAAQRSGR
jgi:DNA-binding transcriptional regulator YiaG